MRTICVVTCYNKPDYVRALVLREALRRNRDNNVIVVKNTHKNVLRYPEVCWKLLLARIKYRPDVYILTFRGYEMLPAFLLLTAGKKRVYDELINLVEWVVYEHHKVAAGSLPARLLRVWYRAMVRRFDAVLADTLAHADYSADLLGLPREKFHYLPVGTEEQIFHLLTGIKKKPGFEVFYYGWMRPLHGSQYMIEAARLLKGVKDMHFTLVGVSKQVGAEIEAARADGVNITYEPWVKFEDLPKRMSEAAVFLAGPFGGTLQAGMVVTGKTYQALALGEPAVVGKTENAPELKDKQNCLIVPQASAQALADTLLWAYKHPKELAAIGDEGRKTFEAHFTTDAIARKLDKILATV